MNEFSEYELREVSPNFKLSMSSVNRLLSSCGLKYEKTDYMAAMFDEDNNAIACGGYDGNTIKCLAVDEAQRGSGVFNKLITHLIQKLYYEGNESVNVFTKPENEKIFVSLGFKLLAKADKAVFMEKGNGLDNYLNDLEKYKKEGTNGAVVVNCNPFTNGHLHLIEYASKLCDNLYVFVVSEDKAVFPAEVRYELVKKGVSHINNAIVLHGGKYIISSATFPSYFLKEYSDVTKAHTTIDCSLFSRFIAKKLEITKRFVGEELTDRVTLEYNRTMEEMLCEYGFEPLVKIPRLRDNEGKIISASVVRQYIAEDRFDDIKQIVPESTYKYLKSAEALQVIERIKNDYRERRT